MPWPAKVPCRLPGEGVTPLSAIGAALVLVGVYVGALAPAALDRRPPSGPTYPHP